MKQISKEWLQASRDDLLVIAEIINLDHLTHLVAFHSQQAIEKALKAVLEEKSNHVPRIHNLEKLFSTVKKYINIEASAELILELDKLYIDSRYPGDMGLLPNGKPTLKDSKKFYDFANKIYNTICTILDD